MKIYKHLFFDLDNTLIDFKANAREAFRDVFEILGLAGPEFDPDSFVKVFEKYNDLYWSGYRKGQIKKEELRTGRFIKTFAERGIDDSSLATEAGNLYLEIAPKKSNLFQNAHETLRYLKERYGLYLITNGFAGIQMQKLEACGLESYFAKIFIAELIGYQKPDRRIFEHAVKSIHAHKKDCLMIGDDIEADIEGAAGADIDQVFFNPSGKESEVKSTFHISSLSELKEFL